MLSFYAHCPLLHPVHVRILKMRSFFDTSQAVMGKATLATVASAALGAAAIWLMVEVRSRLRILNALCWPQSVRQPVLTLPAVHRHTQVVGDFIREQRLKKSGEKEAWMNKAREIAAAVRLTAPTPMHSASPAPSHSHVPSAPTTLPS